MSIRISAHLHSSPGIVDINVTAIDSTVRYAQGAHVTDGAYWFSSPMGPIPGYPARVPSANRVCTVESVTPSANSLRSLSSPTLRGVCRTAHDGFCCVVTHDSKAYQFALPTRLQTVDGIVVGDTVHALNNVRDALKNAILADGFVQSYLETALWSSTMMPEDSEVSDLSYHSHGCDPSDCSLETVIGAKRDCDAFQLANETDLDASDDGIDRDARSFWLSRNGHGAGFFDRCDAIGNRLQELAHIFGEVNLYHVGNDDSMVIYSDSDVDAMGPFDFSCIWS